MEKNQNELKLIRMNEVEATTIDWLWYPYIPFGKTRTRTVHNSPRLKLFASIHIIPKMLIILP